MKHSKVGSVMTSDVVTATDGTPFKEVAQLLARHRVSGLPVVDGDGHVIGVLSETDLMMRQAEAEDPYAPARAARWRRLLPGIRKRVAKARARTAGELMSQPAITVYADGTIAEAARTMARHRVERLPVVDDEERLVGIVTRRDLLQVFLRPDAEIRREVVQQVLVDTLWLAPQTLDVAVLDGVVTLRGQVERRSEVPMAVRMTQQIDGVVAVVDKLTYRFDDSHLRPSEDALKGVADDWLRKL
ncbi:CBS domain-containing protein [Streptomyces flavofungini]|uniref:CBS domain-containing protein n=1 Tax=Streptomyces flavofungini TaxID=68200 RepID=UPI0025B1629B|nr:CBS domain-containing protein [Streptomyces flavofungini]WJV44728.1 CBS domain-containing protein [Streptomyces flavofungini]